MSEDLISRQAAMDAVKSAECMHIFELSEVIPKIRALPAISAVPVVRCKDCKHAYLTDDGECKYCEMEKDDNGFLIERYRSWDWFCADGERR